MLKLRKEVYVMHEQVSYLNDLSIKICDMSINAKTTERSVCYA